MKVFKICFILLFLAGTLSIYAQNKRATITGLVVDSK
jgi:cbb3-type cytochrome oxidase subunit 3